MGDVAGDVPSHETSGAGAGSRHGEYACVARARVFGPVLNEHFHGRIVGGGQRKKERKHAFQGRDGRTARRHHTGIFKERCVMR